MNKTETLSILYNAFATRDMPKIFQIIDPEITVFQTDELPWGGDYKGYEGLRNFFGKLLEHLDSRVTPEEYIEAGDCVMAIGRTSGKIRKTGEDFDVRVAHLWTFRDGKAVRFEAYIDTPAMLSALEK